MTDVAARSSSSWNGRPTTCIHVGCAANNSGSSNEVIMRVYLGKEAGSESYTCRM